MVKKIAIAVWILTATFLGILVINYYGNKKLIANYGEGVYQQNELGFLGFTQPYVNHFNRGNVYYQLGDYEKAKQEYQLALNLLPADPYDCKIRVNYALSYVTPIDVDKITEDNYEDVIEICETAKGILTEKGCATPENDGHYYAAQKLYNEINQFEEQIRQQFEEPSPTPTPDPNNPQEDTPSPTPTPQGSPKPNADATATPTPTPTPEGGSPTPTPQGGTDTPTPTPGGPTPSGGPTPTPGGPTPTPGGETGTPTPTPGGQDGDTPTPTPGGQDGATPTPGGDGTPTPTPGGDNPDNSGTPTPTPGGEGTGTPTPTPGGQGNSGTPTPTPGGQNPNGTPTPTQSPEDRLRDVQDRANRDRYGGGDDYYGSGSDWNFGDSASW
ncbi:MAG: tetratricopeptide repeat protein [Clostridiales bacterium]|jgi:hypothetical protein|nr:tetratricopeptide repeat protein [Clostridiales bacterium]